MNIKNVLALTLLLCLSGCGFGFNGKRQAKCSITVLGQVFKWESRVDGTYFNEKGEIVNQNTSTVVEPEAPVQQDTFFNNAEL